MTAETRIGWIGSLAVHALLLVLFLLLTVPPVLRDVSFLELQWGAAVTPEPARESEPPPPVTAQKPTTSVSRPAPVATRPSQPVLLPERRLSDPSGEALPLARAEKIGPDVPGTATVTQRPESMRAGERPQEIRPGVGEREDRGVPAPSVGEGKALGPASAGAAVGSAAGGAPYSIEWLEGGSRRLVSGALPAYPAGVDVEAQIKLLTVVLPDGSVSSVQPMQKANRALEEAAAREVRQWKFEPLRSYQPQVPQSCVVTFQFRLR